MCEYVNILGKKSCNTKPKGGAPFCGLHRASPAITKCTYFSKCGCYTRSTKGVCSSCQKRLWLKFKKIKAAERQAEINKIEMNAFVDEILSWDWTNFKITNNGCQDKRTISNDRQPTGIPV